MLDYFESIRHIQKSIRLTQEVIEKMISPFQKQLIDDIQTIQRAIENTIGPVIRAHKQLQADIENLANVIRKTVPPQLPQIQSVLNLLEQAATLKLEVPIPDEIYPRLEELASSLNEALPIEDDDGDLFATTTVSQPQNHTDSNKLTWFQFFGTILIPLLVLAYTVLSDYQAQKQHEELIQKLDEFITFIEPLIPKEHLDPEDEDNTDEQVD